MTQNDHSENPTLERIGSRGGFVGEMDGILSSADDENAADSVLAQPLLPNGRCRSCRYRIHVLEEPRFALIKAAIIKVNLEKNRVYAKCPKCKHWLMVPLQYSREGGSPVP